MKYTYPQHVFTAFGDVENGEVGNGGSHSRNKTERVWKLSKQLGNIVCLSVQRCIQHVVVMLRSWMLSVWARLRLRAGVDLCSLNCIQCGIAELL